MHIPKRIIRLAKDYAIARFSALAEQTVVEADTLATRAMNTAGPEELRNLNVVRGFLRGDARTLRTRMDRHFGGLLERAMVTMHANRPGGTPQKIDYAGLTLIDDDVVVRQIEVERMAARLRDVESAALGRVNLTIAVMHNDREARERENPFRPYLLARALFEALRELMWDEAHAKLLYESLGQAMANRLPGFYSGILDIFEAGGISARLTARPTALKRAERDKAAWLMAVRDLDGVRMPGESTPEQALYDRLMPSLQRLRDLAHRAGGGAGGSGGAGGGGSGGPRAQDLLELVWTMFNRPRGAPAAPRIPGAAPRSALDTVLLSIQQEVAGGAEALAPMLLSERLGQERGSETDIQAMDLAALLFQSIVHDELLTPAMQRQCARLYLPFVRATVLEPALLHEELHPARRLLDRLGSLGAIIAPELPAPALQEAELERIVGALLDLFDDDMHIFADAQSALDAHVAAQLASIVPHSAAFAAALTEAQADSARLAAAGAALSRALQPLQVDPRMADFILGTWARVLSHPGDGASAAAALLPALLWSAQEKVEPEERTALMRMLPQLVQQVRDGMATIALPETPSKAAFDRLVAVHMDVLGGKQEVARRRMSLEQFREHFAGFSIDDAAGATDGWLGGFELEAALARRGVTATLHARSAARLPQSTDAELLSWTKPGTPFEVKIDDRYRAALLCAASADESAFMFAVAGEEAPMIYLRAALLEAMEQGSARPLEYAPLYDRAVQSLMAGAESLTVQI